MYKQSIIRISKKKVFLLFYIIEVTALRARLQQIEMSREAIEKELRDKVKGEFIDLVQDLVSVNTKLKAQLDYFK